MKGNEAGAFNNFVYLTFKIKRIHCLKDHEYLLLFRCQ